MTMAEYVVRLVALLREAEDAGLDIDEVCSVTEHMLETGNWRQ